jgi:hypothetical protein
MTVKIIRAISRENSKMFISTSKVSWEENKGSGHGIYDSVASPGYQLFRRGDQIVLCILLAPGEQVPDQHVQFVDLFPKLDERGEYGARGFKNKRHSIIEDD